MDFAASGAGIELAGPKGCSHGWIKETLGLGSATEAAARGAGLPLEPPGLKPHQQRTYRRMSAIGHPHERALAFARRAGSAAGRAFDVGGSTAIFNHANPAVYGDPEDPGEPWQAVPQATLELAHQLAVDWGLDATPGAPDAAAYAGLMAPPAGPVSTEDAMYDAMGYEPAAVEQPAYPGVSELRQAMGI